MGTDYFHGIYAEDTSSAGGTRTAKAIEDVLGAYGLVDGPSVKWGLDAGSVHRLESDEASQNVRNIGVGFNSATTMHASMIQYVLGGVELVPGDDWAWAEFFVVSGADYRLAAEGESGPAVRVVEPPTVSGEALPPFSPKPPKGDDDASSWSQMAFGCDAFDASTGCTAPVCELEWFEVLRDPRTGDIVESDSDFTGLWRTAVLIQTKPHDWTWNSDRVQRVLPETDFKTDLWLALGGSACELGYIW